LGASILRRKEMGNSTAEGEAASAELSEESTQDEYN
jgi:hypothetical protein